MVALTEDRYFGTYCKLETIDAEMSRKMGGNALIIGAEFDLRYDIEVTDKGKETPRVAVTLGGADDIVGYLPASVAGRVYRMQEAGWICHVVPAVIGYHQEDRGFWTEAAVICYEEAHHRSFDIFFAGISQRIAKGEHPEVDLSSKEVDRVLSANGDWYATRSTKLPKLGRGDVYYKKKRTFAEGVGQAAARGDKGCYVGLVAVVIIIIAVVAFLIFR